MDLAYAVVHGDPPEVFAAHDIDTLQKVIALEVVARTPASTLRRERAETIRQALLDERWGDALADWMVAAHAEVDVYPDGLKVWVSADVEPETVGLRLQFRPLFTA